MPIGLIVWDDYCGKARSDAHRRCDNGAPKGRETEFADLLRFVRDNAIENIVWLTADVHYTAAHHYDPSRAAFKDFSPFWEFVSGPLHSGTYGPKELDMTFGPEGSLHQGVGRRNGQQPAAVAGLQFFGIVDISGQRGQMTVRLMDRQDRGTLAGNPRSGGVRLSRRRSRRSALRAGPFRFREKTCMSAATESGTCLVARAHELSETKNEHSQHPRSSAHVDHGKTTLGRRTPEAVGLLPRKPARRRAHDGFQRTGKGTRHHHPRQGDFGRVEGYAHQYRRYPGHADFGGEVERILSMVDGAIVLVDAAEGPMPQTKFVVGKALKVGLRPIVAINKIDRPDARHEEVINEVFDLFAALDATDEQLDFPILYGSGRNGWMNVAPEGPQDQGLAPLLDLVLDHVPEPSVGEGPFRMIGTILEANPFLGRIITGRIHSGSIKPNQAVKVLGQDGKVLESGRISKILAFRGIERQPIEEAHAGDIVAIAGLSKGTVADTFCDPAVNEPLKAQPIDPPTVTMSFLVNDSPLAGTEGDKVTSRVIRDRLFKEAEGNVALKIEESSEKDSFYVSGRGELQLAVLIETMRREGFELAVSRPRWSCQG